MSSRAWITCTTPFSAASFALFDAEKTVDIGMHLKANILADRNSHQRHQ